MKKLLFFSLIVAECVVIALIVRTIQEKKNEYVLSAAAHIIDKNNIIYSTSALRYFYELKPGETQKWKSHKPGEKIRYNITKDGLNDRYEYAVEKPQHTKRIITIGDSMTFGLYVSTPQNASEQLEDILNNQRPCEGITKYEVLNLGVPGYDIAYAAERFKKRGQKYNPDLVIWSLGGGDFNEILEYMRPIINDMVSDPENRNDARIESEKKLWEQFSREDVLAYQKYVLEDFIKTYTKNLLIYKTNMFLPEQNAILQELVKKRSDIFLYDFSEILTPEALHIPNDPHLNAKGNALIARELMKLIQAQETLLCK